MERLNAIHKLGDVCGHCGWKAHAWVLMGNHFHLLLETPEANLVVGMKWLLGTFSQPRKSISPLDGISQQTVVTNNTKEFRRIDGLAIEDWR